MRLFVGSLPPHQPSRLFPQLNKLGGGGANEGSFRGSLTCNGDVGLQERIDTDGGWIWCGVSAEDIYCVLTVECTHRLLPLLDTDIS